MIGSKSARCEKERKGSRIQSKFAFGGHYVLAGESSFKGLWREEFVKDFTAVRGNSFLNGVVPGGGCSCDKPVRGRIDPVDTVSVSAGEFAAVGAAVDCVAKDSPGVLKVPPVGGVMDTENVSWTELGKETAVIRPSEGDGFELCEDDSFDNKEVDIVQPRGDAMNEIVEPDTKASEERAVFDYLLDFDDGCRVDAGDPFREGLGAHVMPAPGGGRENENSQTHAVSKARATFAPPKPLLLDIHLDGGVGRVSRRIFRSLAASSNSEMWALPGVNPSL